MVTFNTYNLYEMISSVYFIDGISVLFKYNEKNIK